MTQATFLWVLGGLTAVFGVLVVVMAIARRRAAAPRRRALDRALPHPLVEVGRAPSASLVPLSSGPASEAPSSGPPSSGVPSSGPPPSSSDGSADEASSGSTSSAVVLLLEDGQPAAICPTCGVRYPSGRLTCARDASPLARLH